MAERSNAIFEVTRFWLQARHSCLIYESLPVPVPYNQSDIDLLAIRSDMQEFGLPDGTRIGPRVIVETKDEKDWDSTGREFGGLLAKDVEKMQEHKFVPERTACKFSMLRQEHFARATEFFGCTDFDRLFVLHAVDGATIAGLSAGLRARRIHVLTIRELVADLHEWYRQQLRPAGLRHSLMGDLWHLMFGFCGCTADSFENLAPVGSPRPPGVEQDNERALHWQGPFRLFYPKAKCPACLGTGPGVYKMRIVGPDLSPIPILRPKAWDKDGVLKIGSTSNISQRFRKHVRDYSVAMETGDQQAFRDDISLVHKGYGLSFECAPLPSEAEARIMETELQASYHRRFGEVPETNSRSVVHVKQHPWRVWLREASLRSSQT